MWQALGNERSSFYNSTWGLQILIASFVNAYVIILHLLITNQHKRGDKSLSAQHFNSCLGCPLTEGHPGTHHQQCEQTPRWTERDFSVSTGERTTPNPPTGPFSASRGQQPAKSSNKAAGSRGFPPTTLTLWNNFTAPRVSCRAAPAPASSPRPAGLPLSPSRRRGSRGVPPPGEHREEGRSAEGAGPPAPPAPSGGKAAGARGAPQAPGRKILRRGKDTLQAAERLRAARRRRLHRRCLPAAASCRCPGRPLARREEPSAPVPSRGKPPLN